MRLFESSIINTIIVIVFEGIIFYFGRISSRKIISLTYQLTSTRLIKDDESNIPGLKVTIYDESVKNLIVTKLRFINTGNQNIELKDFLDQNPLQIISNEKIYSVSIMKETNTERKNIYACEKRIDSSTYQIQFSLLKPKWSFTVIVTHTGAIALDGCLKNGFIKPAKIKKKL